MTTLTETLAIFQEILSATKEMKFSLTDHQDLNLFNDNFKIRSNLIATIHLPIDQDSKIYDLINEILKFDKEIEFMLKIIQKEIAYEHIRLAHSAHSLTHVEPEHNSYIDIKT